MVWPLQIQTGSSLDPFRRHRVDVTLPQDEVFLAPDLDLVAVLGVEQHAVARLDASNVGAHHHHLGPDQALRQLGRGRDQDPATRLAFSVGPRDLHEQPVRLHLDGLLRISVHYHPKVASGAVGMERVTLETSDGLALEGELAVPDQPWCAAALAHPHPQYGGSMRSIVIGALFAALPENRVAALRFNFRGVEGSEGLFDEGRGERHDIVASLDVLHPITEGLPLILVGWSFGADTSLSVVDERITAWFAVAPPLRRDSDYAAASDSRPKFVAVPEHDQFRSPSSARPILSSWTNTSVDVVKGADHFLVGRTDQAVELFLAFAKTLSSA